MSVYFAVELPPLALDHLLAGSVCRAVVLGRILPAHAALVHLLLLLPGTARCCLSSPSSSALPHRRATVL